MTFGTRAIEHWPILVILVGMAASLSWTAFMLWAAVQAMRWLLE